MARFEFSGVEDIDELLDSVLFSAWLIVASIVGAYTLLEVSGDVGTYDTLTFFYFMVVLGTAIFVGMVDRLEAPEGHEALYWSAR